MTPQEHEIQVELSSYIAHPYRPERERVITILKESGVNRARTTANRQRALEEYLMAAGMTLEEFRELERKADEPFYRDRDGVIIVPELHVMSMIVATCDEIRAAGRPCPMEMARTLIRATSWRTDRTDPDGVWERFAVVTGGTGAKLSNQRALRSNPYIGTAPGDATGYAPGVPAHGSIWIDPSTIKPDTLASALKWAGERIGIGASRKMGWGRFKVIKFVAV